MPKGLRIKNRKEYGSKGAMLTFPSNTPVIKAAKAMSEKNYGSCLVVEEDDTLKGIVTERDLMRRLVAEERDPTKTTLKEIMTAELKTAHPDDFIIDWLQQMSNERFRHLPVIDDNNKLITIMSQGDFVSYTWPELYIGRNYRIYFIISSIMLYAIIMVLAVKYYAG
jgi:CBS domain-containing protein